ncbi:hypothetical protein GCM10022222_17980 [Amycolatopsis ultiminotia]|uniref:Uncharacterized protein n=1 Tax=Amycolatopsis ultiminotia TaxID=543629 RepID=A0ABP6VIP0_9PSEU
MELTKVVGRRGQPAVGRGLAIGLVVNRTARLGHRPRPGGWAGWLSHLAGSNKTGNHIGSLRPAGPDSNALDRKHGTGQCGGRIGRPTEPGQRSGWVRDRDRDNGRLRNGWLGQRAGRVNGPAGVNGLAGIMTARKNGWPGQRVGLRNGWPDKRPARSTGGLG